MVTTSRVRSWGYYAVVIGDELVGHVRGDYKVGFVGILLDGTQVGDFPTAAEAGEVVAARAFAEDVTRTVVAA